MAYCAWGCVQRCDLWAWRRNEKRTETFMRQTGYLPGPPTLTYAPEILRAGSYPGCSYIFQVLWKSVHGSRSCGGVENRPLPLTRPMAYTTACTTVQAVIRVGNPQYTKALNICYWTWFTWLRPWCWSNLTKTNVTQNCLGSALADPYTALHSAGCSIKRRR